jgi:hypothetical protein
MNKSIVLVGVGEMGGVFARGFLRLGYPVVPVTRDMSMGKIAKELPDPALVLVAVAESDIQDTLEAIPKVWRPRLGLLQNELLPRDWQNYSIPNPTVISVWFEKKKGQEAKVIIPSPVYGPRAQLIHDALEGIDIPSRVLESEEQLVFELVRKNVYILTSNICGLVTGGTVGELWQKHRNLALQVAGDVIKLQSKLTGKDQPWDQLIAGMTEAFNADPEHKCMGRTAPARLIRALAEADEVGLAMDKLKEIQNRL